MSYSTFIEVFDALGDAIRAKESSSLPIPLYEMPDRIKALSREFNLDGFSGTTWLTKAATAVDTTGMIDMSYMFSNCTVTSLDISDWNTSSVTNMRGMFHTCKGTSIDISGWDTSSVTDMRYMFHSCNVTTLNVANLDTSNVTDMAYLFYWGHANILDLSGWNTANVTDMDSMFNLSGSAGSAKIWVPTTFVATNVTSDLHKPFAFAQALTSADVYTDATDAETQGWGTIISKFTIHYNSTYQDFLNA